ncbi:MAG: hypothetical protein KDA90_05860 [Planctomycetaceae bacterium]|nr:hypothetical protein [Planctomycetaceae bacterium]
MMRSLIYLLPVLALGCGRAAVDPQARDVYPVAGTITYQGRPICDGVVRFHPVKEFDDGKPFILPRGVVDEEGNMIVSTYGTGDGAPAGEYRLSISWQGPLEGVDEDEEDLLPELIPRKYRNPETSGLYCVVSEIPENLIPPVELN